MDDITVVMVTVDRAPNENYLYHTFANLSRSGVFISPRLRTFHVVDSGSPQGDDPCLAWPDRALQMTDLSFGTSGAEHIQIHGSKVRRSGKQNTAAALKIGAEAADDGGWVLFLEDDLNVCGDFLGSVGRWLDEYEGDDLVRPKRPIYPFSGDNSTIRTQMTKGQFSWEYPVHWFWGLQAFACRPAVAVDLAQWLEDNPLYVHTDGRLDENAHDLEMHNWARERGYTYFRGSCPSFVQHLGFETSIFGNTMGGARVSFPTWPGPDWQFK
jgi:hypothetical protein